MIRRDILTSHPGETIRETLEAHGMPQTELSHRTGVTTKQISEIMQGKSSITPETALKLEYALGIDASFWNNLQKNYDQAIARRNAESERESELELLSKYSVYNELAKYGYVEAARTKEEKLENLLSFFGVSSLRLVPKSEAIAYRKSKKKVDNESLAAWLRCGEISAKEINLENFDKKKLQNLIEDFRKLTHLPAQEYSKLLIDMCASAGLALVFSPYFKNTYVNGATRWISKDVPLIQLSVRFKKNDILWFTFFHELGHILSHGKKEEFIEFSGNKEEANKGLENEADLFAEKNLIPEKLYQEFIRNSDFSDDAILLFSKGVGISPDIVAGRLANDKFVTWPSINHLRQPIAISASI